MPIDNCSFCLEKVKFSYFSASSLLGGLFAAQPGIIQLDEAQRWRFAAASFIQKREREERDRAKRAGGATWARYLQEQSQRNRRYNLSTRLNRDQALLEKRRKRFRRTNARRDVAHLCLHCKNVLQNWRPNKEFCGKKCSSERRRSFYRLVKQQVDRELADIAGLHHFRTVLAQAEKEKRTGGPVTSILIVKQKISWASIDCWSANPASAWKDLPHHTKAILDSIPL